MTATLTVDTVDISCDVWWDVTVTAGRDDIESQPDATVLHATVDGWIPAGTVGSAVTLTDPDGTMFQGTITDLDARLDGDNNWQTRIGAVGPLADLGRIRVGREDWTQESDSQRINHILTLTGLPHGVTPNAVGPQILARPKDPQPALGLAQATASDALGVLWEQPAHYLPIRYQPARLRAWDAVTLTWGELPVDVAWENLDAAMTWDQWTSDVFALPGDPGALTLDACEIVADVGFSQRIADLARSVRVTWGVAPSGGSRPDVVAGAGLPELARTSELAVESDALGHADTVWRARRAPAWRMSDIRIDLTGLAPARAAQIRRALAVGLRITIENMGFAPPVGARWQGYLEGWTHRLDPDSHELVLAVSDRTLTEPADRWQDIDTLQTWDGITPDLTWDDLTHFPEAA